MSDDKFDRIALFLGNVRSRRDAIALVLRSFVTTGVIVTAACGGDDSPTAPSGPSAQEIADARLRFDAACQQQFGAAFKACLEPYTTPITSRSCCPSTSMCCVYGTPAVSGCVVSTTQCATLGGRIER